MAPERLIQLIAFLPIFLISITLHEFAHAWAADRLGDPTPRVFRRVTLNPIAHIDPFGCIVFIVTFLSGRLFGWAKPVPVNHFNFRNPRRDFAMVSISGPGANFMQAIAWYFIWTVISAFASTPSLSSRLLLSFAETGLQLNIVLACFNMIPIPPLDGSRVLAFFLPEKFAIAMDRFEHQLGPYGATILIMVLAFTGILWRILEPMQYTVMKLFPGLG